MENRQAPKLQKIDFCIGFTMFFWINRSGDDRPLADQAQAGSQKRYKIIVFLMPFDFDDKKFEKGNSLQKGKKMKFDWFLKVFWWF